VLTLEAHRAGALVIGEDLGTVEPWIREALDDRGIFGTNVLWFERDERGGAASARPLAGQLPGRGHHARTCLPPRRC